MDVFPIATPGDSPKGPEVPKGEAAQEQILTGEPRALGYRPRQQDYWSLFGGEDGRVPYWEVLRRVPAMVSHPIVLDVLNVYKAGIYPAKFEVKASSQQVGEFALAFIRRFWSRSLAQAQLTYHYGWGGYEVLYEERSGRLQFKDLMEFQALDVKVLTKASNYVGIRVESVEGQGQLDLWGGRKGLPAKGLWLTHNRFNHRWHGLTQLYGAFKPWFELAPRDGLEEAVSNGVYRFAYSGPIVKYPKESELAKRSPAGEGVRRDGRDVARELGDNIKTGGTVGLPSEVYPDTKTPKWEIVFPEHVLDVAPLITYDEYLCDKISFGVGVPPEMRKASETGSGYNGRNITAQSFYVGQQTNASETVRPAMEQIGSPLIVWNYGPGHWAEITVKPLLESQQQQTQGQPGADGQPPMGPPGSPGAAAPGAPGPDGPGGPAKPDLAAMFGQPDKKPQPGQQTLSLRADGRWIETHMTGGDSVLVQSTSTSISVPAMPWKELALNPLNPSIVEYDCPKCGGTAYNGDPKTGTQFRGGGACADCGHQFSIVGMKLKPRAVQLALRVDPPVPEGMVDAVTDLAHPDPLVEEIARQAAEGYARMLKRAQRELSAALNSGGPSEAVIRVESVLRKYQPILARLLTDSRLAASLAGALKIADHPEFQPNMMPPSGTQVLQDMLQGRPKAEADAVRKLVSGQTPIESFDLPADSMPEQNWKPVTTEEEREQEPAPIVTFPMIEEATEDLRNRQAMTREDFDALHGAARDHAFTVAGLATAAAVEKVRDAAANAVSEGTSKKKFKEEVEAQLGEGTFLSPAHMETVFRGAVSSGYSNGQDRLLSDPRIGDGFPYVARYAIHDQRVRPEHLAMERLGIGGTNVYRRDDPVYQKFRAPFSWNCRCNDTPLTVKQAAAKGVQEAIDWLASGQPPAQPAWVDPPPFDPPPNWQRLALEGIGVKWLAFNPSEPRDDHGEWTGGGGSPHPVAVAKTLKETARKIIADFQSGAKTEADLSRDKLAQVVAEVIGAASPREVAAAFGFKRAFKTDAEARKTITEQFALQIGNTLRAYLSLETDPQWLAVMSSETPGGHTGLMRPRDPMTHKIVSQGAGGSAGAPGAAGPPVSDEVKVENETHSFASTQFNLADAGYPKAQGSPVDALKGIAAKISDEDLAEKGREDESHITIKYGLHRPDPSAVVALVKDFGPVVVQFGKTAVFTGGKDGDVVYVVVESPRLRELNRLISDSLPHTDKWPEYKPHVCVGYTKPGTGEKYVGLSDAEGLHAAFKRLVFSAQDGTKTVIELTA